MVRSNKPDPAFQRGAVRDPTYNLAQPVSDPTNEIPPFTARRGAKRRQYVDTRVSAWLDIPDRIEAQRAGTMQANSLFTASPAVLPGYPIRGLLPLPSGDTNSSS